MFGANTKITIKGLPQLASRLEPGRLLGGPVKGLLTKAAIMLERRAKEKASGRPGPRVVTGRLRASITHELDAKPVPMWAKVGSDVKYAPFVEFGHLSRGGTKVPAYPFLTPALEELKEEIEGMLGEAAAEVENNFKK